MPYPNPREERYASNQLTPSTNPTRANYEFLGWDTNPETDDPYYWSEQTIEFPLGGYSVTLYAIWDILVPTGDHLALRLRHLKNSNPSEEWPYPQWNDNVMTLDGLTFTVNLDEETHYVKEIVVNGTASSQYSNVVFKLTDEYVTEEDPIQIIETDTITDFTCCPTGGSRSTYYVGLTKVNSSDPVTYTYYEDFGSGLQELPAGKYQSVKIIIKNGTVMNNVKFKPKWIDHDIDPFPDDEILEPLPEG